MALIYFKKHFSLIFCLIIFLLAVIYFFFQILTYNSGTFIYGLDDTYVHMTIAKNLVEYHVWGVTSSSFSSAGSSILFPIIIAIGFFIFGVNSYIPLFINVLFSILIIFYVYRYFTKYSDSKFLIISVILTISLFSSLLITVFIGLEHTLQILVDLVFITYTASYLANLYGNEKKKKNSKVSKDSVDSKDSIDSKTAIILKNSINSKEHVNKKDIKDSIKNLLSSHRIEIYIYLLSMLVTATRYEGFLIISIMGFLFIIRKRFKIGLLILFFGFLPIGIYGIISMLNGWHFFPDSAFNQSQLFVMAGSTNITGSVIQTMLGSILQAINLRILHSEIGLLIISVILLIFLIVDRKEKGFFWNENNIMVICYVFTFFVQSAFIGTGLLLRYVIYLYVIGVFLIFKIIGLKLLDFRYMIPKYSKNLNKFWKNYSLKAFFLISLFIALTPVYINGLTVNPIIKYDSQSMYSTHYQEALFLNTYYNGKTVAIDDIGSVTYYNNLNLIDLVGLANIQIENAKLNRSYDDQFLNNILATSKCEIVITSRSLDLTNGSIPSNWIKAGEWVFKGSTTTFYAVNSSYFNDLVTHLQEYSPSLPASVTQDGFYTR